MKNNFNIFAVAIAAIMTLGCVTLVSCNKEDASTRPSNTSSSKGNSSIPHFSTREEMQQAIDAAISFDTITDLIAYEQEQGRSSIGATSDAFYESVNPEIFNNENEVLAFFEKHKDVLDTIMENDEVSIMPKWFYTPHRYVANTDGMFSVGKLYYKLFKNGIVATDNNHLKELSTLNEEELDDLDTTIFFFIKGGESAKDHNGCQKKWYYSNKIQSGSDRVVLELTTSATYYSGFGYVAETMIHTYSRHRWAGIWWICRHTLTCQGDVTWHRKTGTSSWDFGTKSVYKKKKCIGMWIYVNSEPCVWGIGTNYYHYYAYHLSARTPGLAYAILSHN